MTNHPKTVNLSPEKRRLMALLRRQKQQGERKVASQPFQLLTSQDRELFPAHIVDAYPLGGVQLGMLFHLHLAGAGKAPPAYHNVSTFRIAFRKPFDLNFFQEAVDAVVARHAIYRTYFDMDSYSEPLQLVREAASLQVGYEDLGALPALEQEARVAGFIDDENFRLIPMDQAPLMRLHIHRHQACEISLSLTEPHSIADGWSTHLTLVEIFTHYLARVNGHQSPSPKPLTVSYRDFIQLEQEAVQSRETNAFWMGKLRQCAPCRLPLWPKAADDGIAAEDHKLYTDLPEAMVAGLRRWAVRFGFPLKSILLAVHLKVLSLLTGRDQVTTGLVVNGRPEVPDGDRLPGLFLNTLPLPLTLVDGSWVALVRQAFEAEGEMTPHRRFPLPLLQAKRRDRLFETAFCFLNFHSVDTLAAERELDVVKTVDRSMTNFELMVIFRANPSDPKGMRLSLQSNLQRLTKHQLAWMHDYYLNVLEALLQDLPVRESQAHHDRDLIPAAERAHIMEFSSQALSRQPGLLDEIRAQMPALGAVPPFKDTGAGDHGLHVYLLNGRDQLVPLSVSGALVLAHATCESPPFASGTQTIGAVDPAELIRTPLCAHFTQAGVLVLDSDLKRERLAWWPSYLAGAAPLALTPDQPRTGAGPRWEELPVPFEPEGRQALATLAASRSVPVADLLVALQAALLFRYAASDDGVLGVVGEDGSLMPLRLTRGDDAGLAELGRAVRDGLRECGDHLVTPLAALVDALNQGATTAAAPIFRVLCCFHREPDPMPESLASTLDLGWYFQEDGQGLVGKLRYNRALFEPAGMARLVTRFRMLTDLASAECRPQTADLMDAEERRRVLATWNRSGTVTAGPWIHHLFEDQAARTPDAVALIFEGNQLSYASLNRRADQVAAILGDRGIGLEMPVGVFGERSPEMVVALLGILKAGAHYVPLPPEYPPDRLGYMMELTRLRVVLTTADQNFPLARTGIEAISLANLPLSEPARPRRRLGFDHAAYLIFTSGSTGRPKGVLCGHLGLRNRITWLDGFFPLSAADRVLQKTSFGFDVSVWEFFWPLSKGATLVLARPGGQRDPEYLQDCIRDNRVSVLHFVPSMLAAFLDMVRAGDVPTLKWVFLSGEALTHSLQQRFFDKFPQLAGAVSLHNFYGLTETAIDMSYWHCRPEPARETVPIGAPFAAMKWFILNRRCQPEPAGLPGELGISGPGLARCYVGRPRLTAARFVPNPFSRIAGDRLYLTGDLARHYPEHHPFAGNVDFLGRLDHQVKLRGYRIEPGEIEALLTGYPGIGQAVVMVRPDPAGDPCLVAYIRSEPDRTVDRNTLSAYLGHQLPPFMVPAHIIAVDHFPLSSSGKLDRVALPGLQTKRDECRMRPRRPIEKGLAGIWAETLHLEEVGLQDNFFDLGGHSLSLLKVRGLIKSRLGRQVTIVELFEYPTIEGLARFLEPGLSQPEAEQQPAQKRDLSKEGIAVIGMAGRFPGAPDLDQFQRNLEAGTISISFLEETEICAEHREDGTAHLPNYVRAKGIIEGIEDFDAAFFRMAPREAQITDPQHRLFLEAAWHALENAGYDPRNTRGRVGVFAGAAVNTYAYSNVMAWPELARDLGQQLFIANDPAYLATRVAYKLNLSGPAMSIQTACSTSLVAIIQACRNLLAGDCELALAGGVALSPRQMSGYLYKPGGITSGDGHCRPFDARADGTVPGHGLGIVVLKPLGAARADGDRVLAVIKGFAVNNDGADKAGFTAPSVSGQARAIADALQMAGADPESIDYIETHGTGTALGDPIEIAALKKVFQPSAGTPAHCALGSVKANIGHLDSAAGVAGFIKAVLALQHARIPANPQFQSPNPELGLENSPFYINRATLPWPPPAAGQPRRAGISSFGIGGTNAHLILEQAPAQPPSPASTGAQLLPLSAASPGALENSARRLSDYLSQHPQANLADIAFTLQTGRSALAHRRVFWGPIAAELGEKLAAFESGQATAAGRTPKPVVFLLSGQGSQYVDMGRGLYAAHPVFREALDTCARLLQPKLGLDLRQVLYPDPNHAADPELLNRTAITQPALFAIQYALARTWQSWGIRPAAMLGHSIGELVAATIAGVFTLESGLALVAERGRLMQAAKEGRMLAVALGVHRLNLAEDVTLAAVNSPDRCVVAGPVDAIAAYKQMLDERAVASRLLPSRHAFHNPMMDEAANAFALQVREATPQPPQIPFISNVTGTWVTDRQATDASYWADQMRQTVHFARGLDTLIHEMEPLLLEVGPGDILAGFARRHASKPRVCVSLPNHATETDDAFTLNNLGKLWENGADVDWAGLHPVKRNRLALPSYPFERARFWLEPARRRVSAPEPARHADSYLPGWRQAAPLEPAQPPAGLTWLVFAGSSSLCEVLVDRLRRSDQRVVVVRPGKAFVQKDPTQFELVPGQPEAYQTLIQQLDRSGLKPQRVLHLWNLGPEDKHWPALETGFYSLLFLAQSLAGRHFPKPLSLLIVTSDLFAVESNDELNPARAPLLGPAKVIPREYPNLNCQILDFQMPAAGSPAEARLIENVLRECEQMPAKARRFAGLVAYRGRKRWTPDFTRTASGSTNTRPPFRERGTYLITGGLGGIGLTLAEHLARSYQARVILTSRHPFPARENWKDHRHEPGLGQKILRLQAMEAAGGTVLVSQADTGDQRAMARLLEQVSQTAGPLNGVIHAAGLPGAGVIQLKTREMAEAVLRPKVEGTRILAEILEGHELDFVVLCSSVSSFLGGPGQVDYCAANAYMDAFAQAEEQRGRPYIAINWDTWQEVGMAADSAHLQDSLQEARRLNIRKGLTCAEGIEAFERILAAGEPQVIVSTRDFTTLIDLAEGERENAEMPPEDTRSTAGQRFPRPQLASVFAAPGGEAEHVIAEIWQKTIGLQRVGIDDNFFELGGDSLLGLQVVDQINQAFGSAMTAAGLYEAPTVRAMARMVQPAPIEKPPPDQTLNRGTKRKARVRQMRKPEKSGAHE